MITRAAVFVAPLLVTSGLALSPALADSSCLWGGTSYPTGALVNAGGVVFSCSGAGDTGSGWIATGQSSAAGIPVSNIYDGIPADYSTGVTLANWDDEAWSLGSTWEDLGMSWSDFAGSTGCYDEDCGGGGDGGGGGGGGDIIELQP